jgi:hypothetical protein
MPAALAMAYYDVWLSASLYMATDAAAAGLARGNRQPRISRPAPTISFDA